MAGVGSSLVGAAALARNVADALGEDVAAVISGYGVADVLDEALGGWFVFGMLDRIRRGADDLARYLMHPLSSKPPPRGEIRIPGSILDPASPGLGLPGDEDAVTLSDILIARPPKLDLLVGHSKGSLVIDAALAEFDEAMQNDPDPFDHHLRVVTFGAVCDIPKRFKNVTQFLGELDWFGGLNSRPDLPAEKPPLAWHYLNQLLPYHLDAVHYLQQFK